jgi:tRNA(adenine34) deaminase
MGWAIVQFMKEQDSRFLKLALDEAEAAGKRGEVPVGALLVSAEGEILARSSNRIVELHDPTAHAEMQVLREGASRLANERLAGTTLYVTLEPCAMCACAISFARVARLVYAAADAKGGAIEHGPKFFELPTCHHRPKVQRGSFELESGELLRAFFRSRR